MNITVTELNKHTQTALETALREPVIVERSGQPTVVMLSYQYYLDLEDALFATAAQTLEKSAEWASPEESMRFLKEDA